MLSEDDPFSTIAMGSGPYMLESWTKGQELVLVRNPNYWRTTPLWEGAPVGPAAIERVVLKKVDEWGTRFAMLQAGDADFAAVTRDVIAQVDPLVGETCTYNNEAGTFDPCVAASDQPLRLFIGAPSVSRTDVFLNFNIANPAEGGNPLIGSGQLDGNGIPPDFFSDVHIRKAFNYCFDWETFIQDALAGEAVQSVGIPMPGMPGYDINGPKYTYDLDKCAEEFQLADLDKDGIAAGEDPEGDVWTTGFRLQAAYNQGNTTRQTVAEILAGNLAEVNELFSIETIGLPWPTFLRNQRALTLPLFISGWIEDIHDPHNWYQPYILGTYGRRQSLPADLKASFEALINAGVAETDPAKRNEIYAQLNQQIYDAAPQIILAIATGRHYEQRWVDGYFYNPIAGLYYYAYSKK
jgi:peptide/nickel transport system substrate-binding protein